MKQVVFAAAHTVHIQDAPTPRHRGGEALVRMRYIGICGSDLHTYRGLNPYVEMPRVPGHELCAEIVEIDENEKGLQTGDTVVVEPLIRCGACYPCSLGRYNCCENLKVLGVHVDGGMAEKMALPVMLLHKLPEDVDPSLGPLVETLSIAHQCCKRGRVDADDRVAVIGAGPIGLCAAMVAKGRGAEVAVIDVVEPRLALAGELGIDHPINGGGDVADRVGNAFGGPPTVVIEAVGRAATLESAVDMVSPAGRVVVVGLTAEPSGIRADVMIKKELDLVASRNSCDIFPDAIRFLADHQEQAEKLVTHRFGLDEVATAMELLDKSPSEAIKIILAT
ncbi:MAG: zinc-binding alcohol dehydrogenase family protein [Planctomycetes bacterium]|nr:zinc-binding alcohol dehydrogenase family protein [Planctomycetota bacterium]